MKKKIYAFVLWGLLLCLNGKTYAETQKSAPESGVRDFEIQSVAKEISDELFSSVKLMGKEVQLKVLQKNLTLEKNVGKRSFSQIKAGEIFNVSAEKPLLLKEQNNRILIRYSIPENNLTILEKDMLKQITEKKESACCTLYYDIRAAKKNEPNFFLMMLLPKKNIPEEKIIQLRRTWVQPKKSMLECGDYLLFSEKLPYFEQYVEMIYPNVLNIEDPDYYAKTMDKSQSIKWIKNNILKQTFQYSAFYEGGFSIQFKPKGARYSMNFSGQEVPTSRISLYGEELNIKNNDTLSLVERHHSLSISPYQSIEDLSISSDESFTFLSNEVNGPVCVLKTRYSPVPYLFPHKFEILVMQTKNISKDNIAQIKLLLLDHQRYFLVEDEDYIFVAKDISRF